LAPLFRYSDWRDAWILRIVGERFGPVLCLAVKEVPAKPPAESRPVIRRPGKPWWPIAGRQPPAVSAADKLRRPSPDRARPRLALPAVALRLRRPGPLTLRRPGRGHLQPALLAIGGTLIVALLGFMVARATGDRHSLVALNQHATRGAVEVSFPSGWRTEAAPASPRFGLTDEIVLAPPAPASGMLIIGRTGRLDPGALPKNLLVNPRSVPAGQIVILGGATFYRYLNLSLRGGSPSESVYALSTTTGTILGVCLPQEPRPAFTSSCERIFGTVRSSGASLGPSPSYASALNGVIAKLNAAHSSADSQLSHARDPLGQARAETALAAADAQAASALLRLNAGTARAPNSALAAALRASSDAYAALARTAARGDARGYSTASGSLTRAINDALSAFAQLRALGYHVG
jgi:hypothetical protein